MDRTRLREVQQRIEVAARHAGRDPGEIDLVVVTKYASDAEVAAVLEDGATLLGESRAAGLVARATAHPGVDWHFIGRLQRNKAGRVRQHASVLHSMDRPSLAATWSRGEQASPPVYVQVDLAGEPQKGGVAPGEVPALVETCVGSGIDVLGLMTIPPVGASPEDARPWFAALREAQERVARDHPGATGLSMGMSDDFEVAVEEGATVLRVGRAIFDPIDHDEN